MDDKEQQIIAKNHRDTMDAVQAEIRRIEANGPDGATDADRAFLSARRSYLTREQRETFGITDEDAKKKGKE